MTYILVCFNFQVIHNHCSFNQPHIWALYYYYYYHPGSPAQPFPYHMYLRPDHDSSGGLSEEWLLSVFFSVNHPCILIPRKLSLSESNLQVWESFSLFSGHQCTALQTRFWKALCHLSPTDFDESKLSKYLEKSCYKWLSKIQFSKVT